MENKNYGKCNMKNLIKGKWKLWKKDNRKWKYVNM